MRKSRSSLISPALFFDTRTFSEVLWKRIYLGIRNCVLNNKLPFGTELPSTRQMASELGISRNTVISAYEQLKSEGYLESRKGSGTFVSRLFSDSPHKTPIIAEEKDSLSQSPPLSKRGHDIENLSVTFNRYQISPRPFQHNIPALEHFPFAIWKKLVTKKISNGSYRLFLYGDPAGYLPLREALCQYLTQSRGVVCTSEEVIITNGTQQSLDLLNKVIFDPGDSVIFEDPGHPGAKSAFITNSVRTIPTLLDQSGLRIDGLDNLDQKVKAIYITPSHQYPSGITMSLERRLKILLFARNNNLWIIEDDEDSEFRYESAPLPALQGLQSPERVIYVGSFSKKLFPGLRLGYIIVPKKFKNVFTQAKTSIDRQSPQFDQAVLADFIAEGHFGRHIKRMRKLYFERQKVMLDELRENLPSGFDICGREAGLHLLIRFPPGLSDKPISLALSKIGIEATSLSNFCERSEETGLLIGFAAFGEKVIREETGRLLKLLVSASAK
jgi:GntR family transcriptional regulator/MocR family aminotransferase